MSRNVAYQIYNDETSRAVWLGEAHGIVEVERALKLHDHQYERWIKQGDGGTWQEFVECEARFGVGRAIDDGVWEGGGRVPYRIMLTNG